MKHALKALVAVATLIAAVTANAQTATPAATPASGAASAAGTPVKPLVGDPDPKQAAAATATAKADQADRNGHDSEGVKNINATANCHDGDGVKTHVVAKAVGKGVDAFAKCGDKPQAKPSASKSKATAQVTANAEVVARQAAELIELRAKLADACPRRHVSIKDGVPVMGPCIGNAGDQVYVYNTPPAPPPAAPAYVPPTIHYVSPTTTAPATPVVAQAAAVAAATASTGTVTAGAAAVAAATAGTKGVAAPGIPNDPNPVCEARSDGSLTYIKDGSQIPRDAVVVSIPKVKLPSGKTCKQFLDEELPKVAVRVVNSR